MWRWSQQKAKGSSSRAQDASGAADGPPEKVLQNESLGEQIGALYRKGASALIANLVVGALLLVALWGTVPATAALAWWATMALVVGLRLAVWRRFQVLGGRLGHPDIDPGVWGRRWVLGTVVTGAIWGSAALWLFPPTAEGQIVFVCAFAGMAAGVSSSASSYLPAFHAFIVPQLAPLILRLVAQRTYPGLGLGMMVLVFGVAMHLVAREGNRVLVDSIRLRLHNARLVAQLSEAQRHLIALNVDLERRVAVRTEALQQAIAAREAIVSLVSHELRTPLMAMKLTERSMLRQMEGSAFPERMREGFLRFSRQSSRLLHLVDQMLDLGQLRRGTLTLSLEVVSVADLVETAKEALQPLISEAAAKIDVQLDDDLVGRWDRQRMVQVLVNLLSNALKYGEGRPVRIRGRRMDDQVRISVVNEGPGIAKEDLEKIFEPFERAGARSGVTGSGLGLFIAKRLVLAHGGQLWAEERPRNTGAEFVIELPSLRQAPELRA